MPAQLVALNDGPNILLDKPILLLGRHPECDIQIDSRKISRRHCCIAQVSDYLVVRDLGSTNGVRINGVRVTDGRLNAGDELTIGNHRYQITWDANFAPPRARPAIQATHGLPPSEMLDPEDYLESAEQPIPLQEPGDRRKRQHETPPPKTEKGHGHSPTAAAAPPEEESLILPDHLELAPSDVYPGKDR
jgi:predicted component of type VI protein secretion system